MSSRRDFLRSLLARSGAGLPALPRDESDSPHRRPVEPVEASPERVARAFTVPADQRDIAVTLAGRGFLEMLPDEKFCTPRDFLARTVRTPLPPPVAAWLSRAQGKAAPDAAKAADAALLALVRAELTGGGAPPERSGS